MKGEVGRNDNCRPNEAGRNDNCLGKARQFSILPTSLDIFDIRQHYVCILYFYGLTFFMTQGPGSRLGQLLHKIALMNPNIMGKSNTVVSVYTTYRHLQQYCSYPSIYICDALLCTMAHRDASPLLPYNGSLTIRSSKYKLALHHV